MKVEIKGFELSKIFVVDIDYKGMSVPEFAEKLLTLTNKKSSERWGIIDIRTVYGENRIIFKISPSDSNVFYSKEDVEEFAKSESEHFNVTEECAIIFEEWEAEDFREDIINATYSNEEERALAKMLKDDEDVELNFVVI